MANYLLLYRSDQTAAEQMASMTPEQAQAEMQLWMVWGGVVGERMVDFGAPALDADGIGDSYIGGYSIVAAETRDELDAMIADHPHRSAGIIQVVELLPTPGM